MAPYGARRAGRASCTAAVMRLCHWLPTDARRQRHRSFGSAQGSGARRLFPWRHINNDWVVADGRMAAIQVSNESED